MFFSPASFPFLRFSAHPFSLSFCRSLSLSIPLSLYLSLSLLSLSPLFKLSYFLESSLFTFIYIFRVSIPSNHLFPRALKLSIYSLFPLSSLPIFPDHLNNGCSIKMWNSRPKCFYSFCSEITLNVTTF